MCFLCYNCILLWQSATGVSDPRCAVCPLRFGKHRKAGDGGAPAAAPAPRLTAEQLRQQQEELNKIAARYRPEGAATAAPLSAESSRHGPQPQDVAGPQQPRHRQVR